MNRTLRDTSLAAHHAVAPDKAQIRKSIVRAFEESITGLTADDVSTILRLHADSVRPRITELSADGILVATDERRITRAGRARKRAGKRPTRATVYALASRMEAKAS